MKRDRFDRKEDRLKKEIGGGGKEQRNKQTHKTKTKGK